MLVRQLIIVVFIQKNVKTRFFESEKNVKNLEHRS